MKKHLSVFMLMARSSIYGLLCIVIGMALAEGALFYIKLDKAIGFAASGFELSGVHTLFSDSGVPWVFGAGFILLVALLCSVGCNFGSRQGYTLGRLSISEEHVFLWQAVYNCICLLIFWAAQFLISLALCRLYEAKVGPENFNGQSVFLAFYRSGFLHSLLPLDETSRYIRNIVMIIALGLSAAAFPYKQRRGKKGLETVFLTAAILIGFSGRIGSVSGDVFIILLAAAFACAAIHWVFWREREYEA